jgi:methyl-accepting chemotaxis protein WspA
MNKMTIWQRLNTAQVILVVLLLIGFGLAFWSERTTSNSAEFNQKLIGGNDQVRSDLIQISDALRGLLLALPGDTDRKEAEAKRYREAELDLTSALNTLQARFAELDKVAEALKEVRDYVQKTCNPFHARVRELINTNPAAAVEYYNKYSDEFRTQRDKILINLAAQVQSVAKTESIRAQHSAAIGFTCTVIVLIACMIVGRFQSSAVTKPLGQLVAALERMRQGDFTQRVNLKRKDEFGILGDGLNRLADDLSGLVGQVQRSGIQVNMTTTEIAATAKEQQSTANEIAATTAEIGATSKQISATSRELVKTMNEVSQVAEDTAEVASTGQAGINRMESNMRQIMDASGSITSKLAVLSEKTANINTVVTTITKVADQTNLLSLNAAIEAEKAGEYGLGFAVVAMEIRRLADQTAVATYDIEKMVKEMQSAVAAGVMGMDKFSEEVRRGVEEIRQVSTQLAQIIHQVQTLTPRFHTVNEGMNAQATGAQQISETLTQLNDAAQQTAESLRQSNIAIEQLNAAAHGLQTSVARFKLEES